jgi:endonuclease/exonuclease/phosphatase family metal-dependent hydrolase
LNFGVYASHWRADFVPSDGLGAVDSGNAILSKYPLHDPTRIALNLRSDQDAIERYFYIKRNLLTAELDPGALGEPVTLVATHTEAYSKDGTKRAQIDRFTEELDSHARSGVVLGGGDLNTLPPGSRKTKGFADSVCEGEFEADDFSAEGDWLSELYERYDEAIDLDEYQRDNTPYFTHTTDKDGFWNRKLDYLFTNGDLIDGLVHQETSSGGMATMPLSDHAPMSAIFRLEPAPAPSSSDSSNGAGDAGP